MLHTSMMYASIVYASMMFAGMMNVSIMLHIKQEVISHRGFKFGNLLDRRRRLGTITTPGATSIQYYQTLTIRIYKNHFAVF